jgi:nucleotide-binding universal stress UspA family protein
MLPICHILLPTDFSDRSADMAEYVKSLARTYNSRISLLHVAEYVFVGPTGAGLPPIPLETPLERIEELEAMLDTFAAEHFSGITAQRTVLKGDVATQIVDYAQTEGVDLIAMPTHGRGILRRFLLGSITAKVLHDAKVPVLTGAHFGSHPNENAGKFNRILCSVSLDEHSRSTLTFAAGLAGDLGAKLGIVHALPVEAVRHAITFGADRENELIQTCKLKILQLEKDIGITADVFVKIGKPVETVCHLAKSIHGDLVIVGRSTGDGVLTGTAYDLIRESPSPVISV